MKRLTLVFVGCLFAVVGLGVAILLAHPAEHAAINTALGQVLPAGTEPVITPLPTRTWGPAYDDLTPISDVQSAENVPIYPGAQDVLTRTSVYQHHLPDVIFYTDDSLSEITSFYSEVLPKLGWHLVEEGIESFASGQTFAWSDPDGTKQSPYSLVVGMIGANEEALGLLTPVTSGPDGSKNSSMRARSVEMEISRKPYASRIPLYPDATQIEVQDRPYGGAYIERITRYRTKATPKEIEAYYNTILAQYGWEYGNPFVGVGTIDSGLIYLGAADVQGQAITLRADISAQADPAQGTLVKIRAIGEDLRQLP